MRADDAGARKLHVTFLFILALAVSLLFFRMIQDFVVTVLLAAIFAALTYPFYSRVVAWFRGRRALAATVTVVLLLLCVVIPALIFLGFVAGEAVAIGKSALPWVKQHVENPGAIDRLFEKLPLADHLAPYKSQILEKAGEVAQKLGQIVGSTLASATEETARLFLFLFVFFYAMFQFLLAGPELPARIFRYVPLSEDEKHRTLTTFTTVTQATLSGAVVVGMIQAGLAGVAFAVVGIHGALFWTAIMVVMSFIPGIGTAIIWFPAAIVLAMEGRFMAAIGLLLWCAILVGTIDNFLRPRLVGSRAKLPSLMVLLGTLGGLFYFGPIGLILGPVVAALFLTVWEQFAESLGDELTQPRPPVASRPDGSGAAPTGR